MKRVEGGFEKNVFIIKSNMKVRLPITEMTNGRMGFQRPERFGIGAVTGADGGGVSSCIVVFVQFTGGG